MKRYSLHLTLAGSSCAFLCFSLPWITGYVPIVVSYSTLGLGIGFPPEHDITTLSGFFIATNAVNVASLAYISILIILCLSIYRLIQKPPWKYKTIVLISTFVGFFCTLFTLILLIPWLNPEVLEAIVYSGVYDPQIGIKNLFRFNFGGIGVLISLILTYIGVYNIPKEISSTTK